MAGERYAERAVKALAAWIDSQFTTQLRAVETAESLAANSLLDPADVLSCRAPNLNASPNIQVYDDGWEFIGPERNKLMSVDCTVLLDYTGGPDLEANELFMRRYLTALIATIEADRHLNDASAVAGAFLGGGDSSRNIGDKSATRMIWGQQVFVHVHTP